jgi:hypothetical protein
MMTTNPTDARHDAGTGRFFERTISMDSKAPHGRLPRLRQQIGLAGAGCFSIGPAIAGGLWVRRVLAAEHAA